MEQAIVFALVALVVIEMVDLADRVKSIKFFGTTIKFFERRKTTH